MEHQITIREAVKENEVAFFWNQLCIYFKRDIFPNQSSEDLEYFLSDEYHAAIQKLHNRTEDRCHYLIFHQNGLDIGLAMPVIYTAEDGKCFIMEFCVFPEFRGNGTGRKCAEVLLNWAKEHSALYEELNSGGDERRERFWQSVGFIQNGADEWGNPLMLLPPADGVPITVETLSDPEDWQLKKLENGFLLEIGEQALTEHLQEQLCQAIRDEKITFFLAKRGCRSVGMCSIARCFSTFTCADTGVFDDFYIEPAFRKMGIAQKLAQAAQSWCKENGLKSLTVCCAPCDEEMYQHLGFHTPLGKTFASLI